MKLPPPLHGIATFAAFLLSVGGCKSTDPAAEPPLADYPPPAMPAPAPVPPPPRSAPRPTAGGSIRPGDSLELFVEEDDAFNGTYPVREQGDVIIPSVGRIQVAGLSVGSAGSRIETELEARHLKKATVILDRVGRAPLPQETEVVQAAPPPSPKLRVYLNGKVNRPGQHSVAVPASGRLGVYETILVAGGLSNFADPAKVHVLRNDAEGKKRKIPVNILEIEKGLATDPPIGDGDIVVVPEKVFGF